ncbi:MAG: NAD-dependent epimerase/dehydratase family protein [Bdellovibrionales bacterium]|nr:NAD-dependent epimerase/dehydratase family protein [Bdellovibrionales bacterium]
MSIKKQKAIVTGATGFLGRHLVRELCQKNYEVSILARKSSDLSPFKELPVKVHYGDITNTLDLLQATEEKDIVFHLAGYIAYKRSDRRLMEKINVKGTRNVVDACITNNAKLFHLSSVVSIGASFSKKPINEDTSFNLGAYDLGYFETKKKAEEIVMDAYQEHQLPVYMINPATIYGAGDGTKGSRKTQIKVAKGQFKFYPPGGVNVVYVNDVIDSIFKVLEFGQPARRYIIGGDNLTIKELFSIIAEVSGVDAPSIPIPRFMLKALGFAGDTMRVFGKESSLSSETAVTSSLYHWFDNSRAKKEIHFEPTPARTAIKESISWMKENGYLD